MGERPLAMGKERLSQVIEGAPTACAPVALEPWPVVIGASGTDLGAVAMGTLDRAILPP